MTGQEAQLTTAARHLAFVGLVTAAGSLAAAINAHPAPAAYVLAHLALGAAFFALLSSRLRPGPAFMLGILVLVIGTDIAQTLFYPSSETEFSNRFMEAVLWPGLSAFLVTLFALTLLFPRQAFRAYSSGPRVRSE